MNEGIVQRSLVQQLAAAGNPNWRSINNNMQQYYHSPLPPRNHVPHGLMPPLTASDSDQDLPHSWSHLLLGVVDEEDNKLGVSHVHVRPENVQYHTSNSCDADHVLKQENSATRYTTYCPKNADFRPAAKSTSCLSPYSCISMHTNNFSFSDKSSECKSSGSGGAAKKARINTSSVQSGIKVRKEKLGDRITALHQLVSPFGKTDTASVLLEAIGYIRFLQRQIEALSLPYLDSSGSGNMNNQQHLTHTRRKEISDQEFDEDGANKDLKSRGLCLVPISCTVDVGSANYWPSPLNNI